MMISLSAGIRRPLLSSLKTNQLHVSLCSKSVNVAVNIRSFSRTSFKLDTEAATFSKYQYPLAKEAPEVTRTQASEMLVEDHSRPSIIKRNGEDRFDRSGLSSFEIEQIRNQQRAMLPKKLSTTITSMDVIPAGVPSEVAASRVSETLATNVTKLDNGIRVVSQETSSSGPASTVGVISDVGSRHEIHPKQRGVTNLLELLSFGTPTPSFPDPGSFLAMDLGGAAHLCATGREQSLHFIDMLRPHVDQAFPLLQQVLLEPQLTEDHVQGAIQALGFQLEDAPPELFMGEAIQLAAFGQDQSLGQPHIYMEDNPELTASIVKEFWESQFINNPNHIVVSGVGIDHDQLVDLSGKYFGHLQQKTEDSKPVPSVYRGGHICLEREGKDKFVRVGLALKVDGWHSDDLATVCVLQYLMGGGSSFSAGGPGKGMYSRLYREVLNQNEWVHSAEAITVFFDEVGLFGLSGSAKPEHVRRMVQLLVRHLSRLAVEPVTDEELERARNMLRGTFLTQLESRLVLCEDLGRQVLTNGKHEDMQTTCGKIQSVTAADIQDVAKRALAAGPPTFVAVGPEVNLVPSYDEIVGMFK